MDLARHIFQCYNLIKALQQTKARHTSHTSSSLIISTFLPKSNLHATLGLERDSSYSTQPLYGCLSTWLILLRSGKFTLKTQKTWIGTLWPDFDTKARWSCDTSESYPACSCDQDGKVDNHPLDVNVVPIVAVNLWLNHLPLWQVTSQCEEVLKPKTYI